MEDSKPLNELKNQQRPVRRNDKTYGRKKAPTAESRAMHFDLFGGGPDENHVVHKMDKRKDEDRTLADMEKLTITDLAREKPVPPVLEAVHSTKQQPFEHNPRLRGRRKPTSQKKMATLTPEKSQALNPLLKIVGQDGVKDFQEFGRTLGKRYLCTKLGEGSYADVYALHPKDLDEARDVEKRGGLIIKVIPFRLTGTETDDIVDLDAITREIQLFQTVDALHGFVRCRGTHIVSGVYPDVLLEAFYLFTATHSSNTAVNPDPLVTAVRGRQLYAILEMNNAGEQLGRLRSASAFQVFDFFWKTAISLAHAERQVEFEHRDLHTGNLCFKPTIKGGPLDIKQEVLEEMKEKPDVILGLSNLQITIIDYTLSRAKIRGGTEDELIVFDPITWWDVNSADHPADSEADKRQFKTYVAVRGLAEGAEAEAKARAQLAGAEYKAANKYEHHIPKSNVLWLRYLLVELLACGGGGRGASLPGSSRAAKKVQMELWRTLDEVEAYLNGTMALLPVGAANFVDVAVAKGWLSKGDVAAFEAQAEE